MLTVSWDQKYRNKNWVNSVYLSLKFYPLWVTLYLGIWEHKMLFKMEWGGGIKMFQKNLRLPLFKETGPPGCWDMMGKRRTGELSPANTRSRRNCFSSVLSARSTATGPGDRQPRSDDPFLNEGKIVVLDVRYWLTLFKLMWYKSITFYTFLERFLALH